MRKKKHNSVQKKSLPMFKFSSQIFYFFLIAFTLNCGLPARAETNTQTPMQNACGSTPKPRFRIFENLESVSLYVKIQSNKYEYALKCNRNEEACVEQSTKGIKRTPQQLESYADAIRKDYSLYPTPLRLSELTKIYADRLNKEIIPFVRREKNCKSPTVKILNSDDVERASETPNNITLIVNLNIIRDTKPPIAILSSYLHSPAAQNKKIADHFFYMNDSTAIPLTLSDLQIQEIVDKFSNRIVLKSLSNSMR